MKNLALYTAIVVLALAAGCEVQSEIAKKSVEKYVPTPTPVRSVVPEEPVDPADVVTVDTGVQGPSMSVNKPEEGKRVRCDKYNRVLVNGHGKEVNIQGACKQLMVNGNRNQVKAASATEIIVNGDGNTVEYSKFVNGNRPSITDNGSGNSIVKAAPAVGK